MLVTFSTPAHADITLFGEAALALLERMGRGASVPGALLAEDVAAARDRLKTAIDAEKSVPAATPPAADDDDPPVSLAQRAQPLLGLLSAAAREQEDVMWK